MPAPDTATDLPAGHGANPARWPWFARLSAGVLLFNFLVVAWGAFVRTSFSGDGCGTHWPDCGGQLVPAPGSSLARYIEFSHRATSGLLVLGVLALYFAARRGFPREAVARKASFWAIFFTATEALLGAVLVKWKLVAHDESAYRAVAMSAHLINTLILFGCLGIAFFAGLGYEPKLKGRGGLAWGLGFAFLLEILLGISGALSALGHTVRPVDNVLAAAVSPGAHFLNRLQPIHPFVAMPVFVYLLLLSGLLLRAVPGETMREPIRWMLGAYLFQAALGMMNILLGAPTAMQLLHLASADFCWVTLLFVAATALSAPLAARVESGASEGVRSEVFYA